ENFLKSQKWEVDYVAKDKSGHHNEQRVVNEKRADLPVAGAQRFKQTNGIRSFNNEDQQNHYDIDDHHNEHNNDDHRNIIVEDIDPVYDLRVLFSGLLGIIFQFHTAVYFWCFLFYIINILQKNLVCRLLLDLNNKDLTCMVYVVQNKLVVYHLDVCFVI